MKPSMLCSTAVAVALLTAGWSPLAAAGDAPAATKAATSVQASNEVPITTASPQARELFIKGRDLAEKLRAVDARAQYEKAVQLDSGFALAWLGLANTATNNKDFFAALEEAVKLAPKASEGERLQILGFEAGVRSNPARQKDMYDKLAAAFPRDARVRNLVGNYHFGRQEWNEAVLSYEKAIAIAPAYSQPYNQLGYAYRFLGRYPEAEKTFKKYTEIIPDEPNPYDSYAELLMKIGRFDESIQQYRKALAADPTFVASYIGIANNQVFLGEHDAARKTLGELLSRARNEGEKRQAWFWTSVAYLHEGKPEAAMQAIEKERAVAEPMKDHAAIAADEQVMGEIALESGKLDLAQEKFRLSVATLEKASVPEDVKAAGRRQGMYDEARVLVAKGDLKTATARTDAYCQAASQRKLPFEVKQCHELRGMGLFAAKDHAGAAKELAQANDQDPRVLYLSAQALQGAGRTAEARKACAQAADFNALALNFAFVRDKARKLLEGPLGGSAAKLN